MASKRLNQTHTALGWTTVTLGILTAVILGYGAMHETPVEETEAWLVRPKVEIGWESIEATQIMSGTVIHPSTHTVFHLPEGFKSIVRETLFGHRGKSVRYWGYCFPANYDPKTVDLRRGFPGLIFLSEKERAMRAAEARRAAAEAAKIDPLNLPTQEQLQNLNKRKTSPIRHQLEVFEPSTLCYIMSEAPLAIGIDIDGDRLNGELERQGLTNPKIPDTDGDGIIDGIEHIYGTLPLIRDTDGDGLVDGIEDSNWNGRIDMDETDPRNWDSDRDGLCDGLCRVRLKRQELYMGEDKNLNGIVDEGETNPTLVDTDGDGTYDNIQYLQCLAEGRPECQ